METMLMIFMFGGLFSLFIQYVNLNKYNVISAKLELKNNTVVRTILLTLGIRIILLYIIASFDLANFNVSFWSKNG